MTLGTGLLTSLILEKLNNLQKNSKPQEEKEKILKTLPHLKNLNKVYAPGI